MSQTATLSGGCSSAATAPSHASIPSSSELRIRTGTPVPRAERVGELVAVAALAAGRGDEDLDPLAAEPPRPARLRARDLDGLGALRRADVAIALDLLAEAELLLLLVHGQHLPAVRDGDEQAERVRAHVDDRDSHALHCSQRVGWRISGREKRCSHAWLGRGRAASARCAGSGPRSLSCRERAPSCRRRAAPTTSACPP